MTVEPAVAISIAALIFSIAGPVVTSYFALREANRARQAAEARELRERAERTQQAADSTREQRRQERLLYLKQTVNALVEARAFVARYDGSSGVSDHIREEKDQSHSKVEGIILSIGGAESEKIYKRVQDGEIHVIYGADEALTLIAREIRELTQSPSG